MNIQPPTPSAINYDPFDLVRAALLVHGDELASYPGVVSVRPGYRFHNGIITDQPAISVSILQKKSVYELSDRDLLPRRLGRVPVDVIPASPGEQLRVAREVDPQQALLEAAKVIETVAKTQGIVDFRTPLERIAGEDFELEANRMPYPRPTDLTLSEVNEVMTLICHSSPDTGWRLLRDFIGATSLDLTATMYEFTAPYIKDALLTALTLPKTFDFVMDFERERTGFDNEQAFNDLSQALANRFHFAWAPVVSDRKTTVGYFPSAYHIKVAVRDSQAIWLSSGNWKPSGQPEIDPFDPPVNFSKSQFQNAQNREWHIIAESPALASQFKSYIEYDLRLAKEVQLPVAGPEVADIRPTLPDLFVTEAVGSAEEEASNVVFFPELKLHKKIRIQPLLTPDNYIDFILPLLRQAQHRVFFQNQSLAPKPGNAQYSTLFNTLRDFSNNPDVDTRIIMRGDFNPEESLQVLKQSGINTDRVRMQKGCHTKGIIIDNLAVVVGSHNWTSQGTLENRDASLIIFDQDAIDFYEKLFLYDWNRLTPVNEEALRPTPILATPEGDAPAGMRRVSWSDFYN